MTDLKPCPYWDCDGKIEIEALREDDNSVGYSFHCRKCGGYIKNKRTYLLAQKAYDKLVDKWRQIK